MLGVLLHHRRPTAGRWIAPSRRPVCHPAAAVDQDEQTWMPQRAFSPRQGVLLGAAGEGQGLVGGTSAHCTLHAGCVAPSSECCPADAARRIRRPACAARQIYCHTVRGAQKTPGHGHCHAPGVVGFRLIRPFCACGAGPAGPSRRQGIPTLQRPRWERAWGWREARRCRCCGW